MCTVEYESPISSGKNVMAKVKVFAHASNTDAWHRHQGYDISSLDIRPGSLKNL